MTKIAFIPDLMGFYNMLWAAALPFLRRHPRLARTFAQRTDPSHLNPADVWIQAASAGEALLAACLVQHFSPDRPVRILITTTTDQGMGILCSELEKKPVSAKVSLSVAWFPFDMPSVAARAVEAVNPQVMVLVETELWPALLHFLNHRHTRVMVVNGRMSVKSRRGYGMTKPLWSNIGLHEILAVSNPDAERFRQVFEGARVSVMPNIKFEALAPEAPDITTSVSTDIFPCPWPVSVFASIRRQEETQVLKMIHTLLHQFPGQVMAIFPRHMHRLGFWKRRLKKTETKVYLRSELASPPAEPGIILWDRFGEMRHVFRYAHAVFMGGSLKPLGGQNFLEPLLQGAPVVTGPFWDDFFWVGNQIFDTGLVQREKDWQSAAQAMVSLLKHPEDRHCRQQKAHAYVADRSGGADMACQSILAALYDDKNIRPEAGPDPESGRSG
jgi:3-deoxy-D-manno-octulosonic-acid transferase